MSCRAKRRLSARRLPNTMSVAERKIAKGGVAALRLGLMLALPLAVSACATIPDLGGAPHPNPATNPKPPQPFVGMTANVIRDRLGKPTLIRQEPPAEVWQYADRMCILDITLYADSSGALVARWVESRDTDGVASDPTACGEALGSRDNNS